MFRNLLKMSSRSRSQSPSVKSEATGFATDFENDLEEEDFADEEDSVADDDLLDAASLPSDERYFIYWLNLFLII